MKRVAVVGSGVSGMAAAWLLSQRYETHLFERNTRIGGHTNTVTVTQEDGSTVGVDTGFITYNEPTYPHFTTLLNHLSVPTQASDMSWSLTCDSCAVCYAGNPRGAIPNRHALRVSHLTMLREIGRFNKIANRMLSTGVDPVLTLDGFLNRERFSRAFNQHYLLPMAAAIWSTGTRDVGQFPLATFLTFFKNHGLLGVRTHHPWRSIIGGSNGYISPLTHPYRDTIHRATAITRITRTSSDVTLHFLDSTHDTFDAVVIATHADEALALLHAPTGEERELLGAWQYSQNTAVLHTDANLMPPAKRAWASWNYLQANCAQRDTKAALTYHMNRLQRLQTDTDYFVTLNPTVPADPAKVIAQLGYTHPTYTKQAVETQAPLTALNGRNNTAYAGAYLRYGFHEDGVVSAINAAEAFGVSWPL